MTVPIPVLGLCAVDFAVGLLHTLGAYPHLPLRHTVSARMQSLQKCMVTDADSERTSGWPHSAPHDGH